MHYDIMLLLTEHSPPLPFSRYIQNDRRGMLLKQLKDLKELLDMQVVTAQEYEEHKKAILDNLTAV